jgi:hypothetical protein
VNTENVTFHSPFGGNWIDSDRFEAELAVRLADGRVDETLAEQIRVFESEGYLVLERAVPEVLLDAIESEVESAWKPGSGFVGRNPKMGLRWAHEFPVDGPRRIIDPIVNAPSAQLAAFIPEIKDFLSAIFDEEPLAFQSLYFERGSQQAMHQDTAYVVVSEPIRIAAAWIALEDVESGNGELEYYPGSHKFEDFIFGPEGEPSKSWNKNRDGQDMHKDFLSGLDRQAKERGIERTSFLPKRGDVLLWHADLAHGGTKQLIPEATRRSVVVHYIPVSVQPNYVKFTEHFRPYEVVPGAFMSSRHYDPCDLATGARPVLPVAGLGLSPVEV